MNPSDAKVLVNEQVEGWLNLFDEDMKPREGVSIPPNVLELLAKFEADRQQKTSYPFAIDYSVFEFPAHSGSAEADIWFGRGIGWAHGFNFEEASHCFQMSLDIAGPTFSMGHWGLALCHGPYYNRHGARYMKEGMKPDVTTFSILKAFGHAKEAQSTTSSNTNVLPLHVALINAMFNRCTNYIKYHTFHAALETPSTAPELKLVFDAIERQYANELRNIYVSNPKDPNVISFLAATLMNMAPWKLWLPTDATPREQRLPAQDTLEIESLLKHGLTIAPNHPGLCHLFVHAMEMSPDPSVSLPQANLLAEAGANKSTEIGHLCHMAAHIYMQVGDYQSAIDTSLNAVAADAKMITIGQCGVGIYSGAIHNLHELLFACMWSANDVLGKTTLKKIDAIIIKSGIERLPTRLEPFGLAKFHYLIRFGLFQEILDIPIITNEDQKAFYCTTYCNQCYARGVAYAALGDIASAELEQIEFRKARLSPLLKDEGALSKRRMHNICEQKKLEVAEALLNGEILYRKGMYSDAFVALKKGVDLDDNLPFDEPWGWMVPVRHALAALLLEQGEVVKAIVVYRQDLIIHPKNIWSLVGLRDCLLHRMDAIEDGENKGVMVDEVQKLGLMINESQERTGVTAPSASCACAVVKWKDVGGEENGTKSSTMSCC